MSLYMILCLVNYSFLKLITCHLLKEIKTYPSTTHFHGNRFFLIPSIAPFAYMLLHWGAIVSSIPSPIAYELFDVNA